jgi:heme exporter protein A
VSAAEAAAPDPPPAVLACGLEKRFGPLVALRSLDLEVPRGTTLAVLGPNGAGKSTLLRLLAGLARPSAGTLLVGGDARGRAERRRRIGLLAHATFLYPALTSRENVILAARLAGLRDAAARADRWLDALDLSAVVHRRTATLSRGLAQRVAIARALVHDPELLLLDEPFTGLDPRAATRLAERLAALRSPRTTVILSSHDLARVAALAERALVLVAGRAVPLPPEALADAALLESCYRDAVARLETAAPRAAR